MLAWQLRSFRRRVSLAVAQPSTVLSTRRFTTHRKKRGNSKRNYRWAYFHRSRFRGVSGQGSRQLLPCALRSPEGLTSPAAAHPSPSERHRPAPRVWRIRCLLQAADDASFMQHGMVMGLSFLTPYGLAQHVLPIAAGEPSHWRRR